jgi:hypothetical protein
MPRYTETYKTINRTATPSSFISPAPVSLFNPYERSVILPGMQETTYSSSWDMFERPTMALEMIASIPPLVATTYKDVFFSQGLSDKQPYFNVRLLRLYLGRDLPSTIHELQPGLRSDLGLDVSRYTRFAKALDGIATLPPLSDVSNGMGRVLAQLHFGVGIDGMDVELVIGGDGCHGLRCWLLDFNQCERWLVPQPLTRIGTGMSTVGRYAPGSLEDGAQRLAKRISALEHYYPRPHQALYSHFKEGYLQGLAALIDEHRPMSPDSSWIQDADLILQAGKGFLEVYEAKSRESLETKAILAARRQARSKA